MRLACLVQLHAVPLRPLFYSLRCVVRPQAASLLSALSSCLFDGLLILGSPEAIAAETQVPHRSAGGSEHAETEGGFPDQASRMDLLRMQEYVATCSTQLKRLKPMTRAMEAYRIVELSQ